MKDIKEYFKKTEISREKQYELIDIFIKNGADVNFRSQWNYGITALDSAENTRNYTTGYRKGEDKYNQISEFIDWLKGIGAKSCKDLNP